MATTKTFDVITSKPTKSDKYVYLYNNKNNGGKSLCINGKPTDSDCNVLCNCVGWACARFNHIYNILTEYSGIKYPNFCCNAENFIEVAKNYGLSVGNTPKVGAIMCWQKGATLKGSDGAGHVAVVEQVFSSTKVLTSESGYNSFAFKNRTREKGTDGRWGSGESYTFRGFIYNPAVDDNTSSNSTSKETTSTTTTTSTTNTSTNKIPSTVSRNESVNQLQILVSNLRIRMTPSIKGACIGFAKAGIYNYTDTKTADNYTWYKISDNCWVAYSESWIQLLNVKEKPTALFAVGDIVSMKTGAPVYGKSIMFAPWVYKSTLHVRAVSGNKVTVSVSELGVITGSVDEIYLTKK